MPQTNQWNELVDIFGCEAIDDTVPETAADNILIAWPSIIRGIEQHFSTLNNLTALDYGCGGGLFCHKLHQLGFQVSGYEPSIELARVARRNVPAAVSISHTPDIITDTPYDLISAIMVLPFIDDIDATIATLANRLTRNGMLIYAVFNPDFVADNLAQQQIFKPGDRPEVALLEFKPGLKVPFTIRSAADYRRRFENHGLQECYLDLPPFTDSFIQRYGVSFATHHPEFLIQAFRFK